jgi:hypothetical protein
LSGKGKANNQKDVSFFLLRGFKVSLHAECASLPRKITKYGVIAFFEPHKIRPESV